ncbi:MAG: ATP-binding cassette domain-containing protein [Clostridia bacterium]|nr:ATP-binding cassette domain-containing protein [Clostridia bacterium]
MEHLFTQAFDLTDGGTPCQGQMKLMRSAEGDFLKVFSEEGEILSLPTAGMEEILLTCNAGCGELCAKTAEGDVRLCRFTMTHLEPMSEFVKAMNHYLTHDRLWQDPDTAGLYCPHCGARYLPGTRICPKCARKLSGAKNIMKIAKPFLPGFLVAGLLILLANTFSLIIPAVNRQLIDGYLADGAPRDLFGGLSPVGAVWLLVGAMFVCHLLKRLITVFASLIRNKNGTAFVYAMRKAVYGKIQDISLTSAARYTAGGLINRVTGDSNRIADFIQRETVWIAETAVLFVAVCVYFLVTRPLLMVFIFLPMPIVYVATTRFWRLIRRRYNKQWILSSRANNILHDIIKGIRVVKVFGKEDREVEKFKKANKDLADLQRKNELMWSVLSPALNFTVGAGEFLLLYFGAQAVLGNSVIGDPMTVGELIQTVSYAGLIYTPLHHLTQMPQSLGHAATSAARLNEILSEEAELTDGSVQKPITCGKIEFHDVTFGYTSYEPVLKNMDLTVDAGEMIGIVGHSGAGKSTMINLILRLYDVNSGKITIDGTDLREFDKKTLSDAIGAVFQETFLFEGPIYDNILYARPDATPEMVFRAAKIACCHEFILKLPEGYNTRIGQNGHTLSGGERQRVAIARAVLKDPKILILDEATASLDTDTEAQIQQALQYLVKDRTTIAIAHRLSTLRHADRIVVVNKGKIAEQGPHSELLKQKGQYYDLVMAQKQTTKMAKTEESPNN